MTRSRAGGSRRDPAPRAESRDADERQSPAGGASMLLIEDQDVVVEVGEAEPNRAPVQDEREHDISANTRRVRAAGKRVSGIRAPVSVLS